MDRINLQEGDHTVNRHDGANRVDGCEVVLPTKKWMRGAGAESEGGGGDKESLEERTTSSESGDLGGAGGGGGGGSALWNHRPMFLLWQQLLTI